MYYIGVNRRELNTKLLFTNIKTQKERWILMKKNLKKSLSLALSLAFVFLLSFSAGAADINAAKAESLALKDAGYKEAEVLGLHSEFDFDDGVKYYDVEFFVKNDDGSVLEYSYEISAASGSILDKDVEREGVSRSYVAPAPKEEPVSKKASAPKAASNADVGLKAAKEAAAKHFGFSAEEVDFIKAHKERDDGVYVYDIEFAENYDVKYSCDVLASSGEVVDADKDYSEDLLEKVELFIELLLAKLFNR